VCSDYQGSSVLYLHSVTSRFALRGSKLLRTNLEYENAAYNVCLYAVVQNHDMDITCFDCFHSVRLPFQ
jgi:hypothetical protein